MTVSPPSTVRKAGTSQTARRSHNRRLSATHVLIGVAVLLAFALNALALRDRSATVLVAVAEAPLSAGSTLSADDLRLVPVAADFEGLADVVTEESVLGLEGWVLQRDVVEGGILAPSALVEPGAGEGLRAMAVPVPVEHAAGNTIKPGDRVDVIAVSDGSARFVATGIEVLGVADRGTGSVGAGTNHHLVLAVDADQALLLAEAMAGDGIEVIRSTGAPDLETGADGDDP